MKMNEWNEKLLKSSLKVDKITHTRLNEMSKISGAHRNIVSRLGIKYLLLNEFS